MWIKRLVMAIISCSLNALPYVKHIIANWLLMQSIQNTAGVVAVASCLRLSPRQALSKWAKACVIVYVFVRVWFVTCAWGGSSSIRHLWSAMLKDWMSLWSLEDGHVISTTKEAEVTESLACGKPLLVGLTHHTHCHTRLMMMATDFCQWQYGKHSGVSFIAGEMSVKYSAVSVVVFFIIEENT